MKAFIVRMHKCCGDALSLQYPALRIGFSTKHVTSVKTIRSTFCPALHTATGLQTVANTHADRTERLMYYHD
jgi:hypothetical protein